MSPKSALEMINNPVALLKASRAVPSRQEEKAILLRMSTCFTEIMLAPFQANVCTIITYQETAILLIIAI
jgi:hypothetical protein